MNVAENVRSCKWSEKDSEHTLEHYILEWSKTQLPKNNINSDSNELKTIIK